MSERSTHHHSRDRDDPGHYRDRAWTREEAVRTLEAPERRSALDPVAFWRRAGLASGATVVDIGSGTGYFALPAARQVGVQGHVYAADISRELVDYIAGRSRDAHLPQLAAVESTPDTVPLPSEIADFVLLATVLHDISPSTVREAVRILKPSGRLLDLDWQRDAGPEGPPREIRLTPEDATRVLGDLGLRIVDRWDPSPMHYCLVAARP